MFLFSLFALTAGEPIKAQSLNPFNQPQKSPEDRAWDLYKQGTDIYRKGDQQQGIAKMAEAEKLWPKDGYYAIKQGWYLLYQMNQPGEALKAYDRAMAQGGNPAVELYRDRAFSFCKLDRFSEAEKAFADSHQRMQSAIDDYKKQVDDSKANYDQKKENSLYDNLFSSMGRHAFCKLEQKDFKEGVAITDKGLALQPDNNNGILRDARFQNAFWTGHQAMGDAKYEDAVKYYNIVLHIANTNKNFNGVIEYFDPELHVHFAEKLIKIRDSKQKPEYTLKAHVFYLKKTRVPYTDEKGRPQIIKEDMTQDDIDKSKLHFAVLKRDIEAMSDGRLSIDYSYSEYDVEIKNLIAWKKPVLETLPDEATVDYCKYAVDHDVIWTMWTSKRDGARIANGGNGNHSCISYQLYTPSRNSVNYPINWREPQAARIYVHEFFHTIESYVGIPAHGSKHYPEWKGKGEMSYYYWHFQNTLPGTTVLNKNGYENYKKTERDPFLIDDALLQENLKAVQGLSMENRKKAKELADQAKDYLDKGNNNMALSTATQALKLNPSQPTGLSVSGFAEKNLGRPQNAVKHFIRHNQLRRDRWAYRELAYLYHQRIKDFASALNVYADIRKYFPDDPYGYIDNGWALTELGRYNDAIASYEACMNTESMAKNMRVECGFWKGYVLGEKLNQPDEALPFLQTAYEQGYKNKTIEGLIQKYSNPTISSRDMKPIELPEVKAPVKPKEEKDMMAD